MALLIQDNTGTPITESLLAVLGRRKIKSAITIRSKDKPGRGSPDQTVENPLIFLAFLNALLNCGVERSGIIETKAMRLFIALLLAAAVCLPEAAAAASGQFHQVSKGAKWAWFGGKHKNKAPKAPRAKRAHRAKSSR